jgi:hypothetical protein
MIVTCAIGATVLVVGVAAVTVGDLGSGGDEDSERASTTTGSEDADQSGDASDARRDASIHAARLALTEPAFAARDDAAQLRLLLAEAAIGSDRDSGRVVQHLTEVTDRLEAAADELDGPPAAGDLDALHAQASDVALHLRSAADGAVDLTHAAIELNGAATRFVDAEVHDAPLDDPDLLADAWEKDLERLEDYEAAANDAADHAPLEAHAAAHREVAAELTRLAQDAIDHLDDGGLDAYNASLEDRITEVEPLVAELQPSLERSVEAMVSETETAEGRVLGLLSELEQLRATTPARG